MGLDKVVTREMFFDYYRNYWQPADHDFTEQELFDIFKQIGKKHGLDPYQTGNRIIRFINKERE